ncbi:MAG: AI-2E family transporter [Sebaldella sp.]|nr:AI-2E family transporter [Sebaldella sp.]
MKRYEKLKEVLIIIVLILLACYLFFQNYQYIQKPVNIVIGALVPFISSFIIVYCLMPFIDFLSKKFKINKKLAILIVLTIFLLFLLYIILSIVPLVIRQFNGLIRYFVNNQEIIQKKISEFLDGTNIDLKTSVNKIREYLMTNSMDLINSSIALFSGLFSFIFMTPIFTVMLIFNYDNMEVGLRKLLIRNNKKKVLPLLKQIDESVGKYIKVTFLDCFIIGTLSGFVLYFLKVDYVQLFAIIIGVGNLIPFIGPFISIIPVLIYAATKSMNLFISILVLITILQGIEANIVKPWLTSKSVNIHPITTLLVILIGGALFGIIGAFIAIPVYIIIKLVFQFYILKNKNEK